MSRDRVLPARLGVVSERFRTPALTTALLGGVMIVLGIIDIYASSVATAIRDLVNISGLLVSTTKTPSAAKVKHTYQYAPNESIVASFTATTYFSHDLQPSAAGAGTKPGTPGAR